MKSEATIKKNLRDLRMLVETSSDPTLARIAQAMETAIRWTREETVGWPSMLNEAVKMAAILKEEANAARQ